MEKVPQTRKWGWIVLFFSLSTLLCCALPIILVSLGLGAIVASLATNSPFLIFLSMHKIWVFGLTGALLVLAGWALYRPGRVCPADPYLADLCSKAHKWNQILYWVSVIVWLLGFIAAYVLEYFY